MAKTYVVTKAFQSTDKETKEPQVVNTKGGEMHKFMVQVADQPVPGWLGILKKIGNEVSEGDELYGFIDENQWGKANFTPAQRPEGMQYKSGSSPKPQAKAATLAGSDVEEKLDYLITMVENFLESQGVSKPKKVIEDTKADDDGQDAIDLSELPF